MVKEQHINMFCDVYLFWYWEVILRCTSDCMIAIGNIVTVETPGIIAYIFTCFCVMVGQLFVCLWGLVSSFGKYSACIDPHTISDSCVSIGINERGWGKPCNIW